MFAQWKQWKWVAAVSFAVLAACSSHSANYDSASSAGAVAPDSMARDTTAATPAMTPTPVDTTGAMPVDTTLKDTTKVDSTKKSTRHSRRSSKKK
ncbi:MAG TPA: hypothetical protein VN600_03890 [Gemmatimonadaceae bacterium]|nr:hypothetical protein [Gemmatimonadaceae bacterium]